MNWFYASNGTQQGPVTEADLLALLQAGTISANTQVWQEGMADWKPLSEARPDLAANAISPAFNPAVKNLNVQAMREGAIPSMYAGPLNYAGFWIRFAAKFIDGILMQVIGVIIQMGFGMVAAVSMPTDASGEPSGAAIAMIFLGMGLSILAQALYNGIMVGKFGATLGKMACGLKVVMPDGSKVSMARAFGRYFAEILSGLILLIGYIMAGFDDEKRALHDHIASTRVITTR
jgi:uncharacterized RDD family membrane protein YckC